MRIGLIARADNTGLGNQTAEFFRHMNPARTMVIDLSRIDPKRLLLHLDRFPDAQVVDGMPTTADINHFLTDIDVVYTAETPYNYELYATAAQRGIPTVEHSNYEFLVYPNSQLPRPTLFAAPSTWNYRDFPDPKVLLPVPVATDRFRTRGHRQLARKFLHVVGHPAVGDRNGTGELLKALRLVRADITVTLRCQREGFIPRVLNTPPNVRVVTSIADTRNYWDLYEDQDILVIPRKYGGLCLPALEGVAAGMPVIMPDISPNEWLPDPWRVAATQTSVVQAKRSVATYTINHGHLARLIDRFATDSEFYRDAVEYAGKLATENSWAAREPQYQEVLGSVLR